MLLAVGLVLTGATAALAAAALRLGSIVSFALAAYVLAAAEVVGLALLLSPLRLVRPGWMLGAQVVLLAIAALLWHRRGRPRPTVPRVGARAAGRRHPVVAALAVVVALASVYELAVGLAAPPNNGDSLTYRLSRAAAWLDHGGVHWIDGAHTERQNEFPANGELEQLYALLLAGGDAAAELPQLLAKLALVAAVYGLARRLGQTRPASAFAALLLPTLSEVALEATSTQNDLVTASFVVSAAYFLRSTRVAELCLAGTAVGLGLGTKISAWYALPALVVLAAVSLPRRRLAVAAGAAAVATLAFAGTVGALNVAHTGTPTGNASEQEIFRPDVTAGGTVSTLARIAYGFADLSGFRLRTSWLRPFERFGQASFERLGIEPNPEESAGYVFWYDVNVRAHEDHSFFGPLGLFLLPLSFAVCVAWALGRVPAAAGALGLALPLFALLLALTFRFSDEARYLVVPVALTMPLAAFVYRWRALAAAVAVVAAVTVAFAHGYNELKPTGLAGTTPVWKLDRASAIALDVPERAPLLDAVDARVPANATVGVVLAPSDWDYPLYGPRLDRRLDALPAQDALSAAEARGLRHVVTGVDRVAPRRGWAVTTFPGAGTLLHFERAR